MRRPTLSAALANYNMAQYLDRCIESIASQSVPPDEFVILDDGSTDDSVAVIEAQAARYPFIRLIRHEKNMGLRVGFPRIVSEARGDFFYTTGSDDYILPGFFEESMRLAALHPQTGTIVGETYTIRESGEKRLYSASAWQESQYVSPARFLREYLDRENSTHSLSSSVIYRTEVLKEIGNHQELGYAFDHFNFRASAAKYGTCYIPKPCAVALVRKDSQGNTAMDNPRARLDTFGRMAYLMRTPEFRDRFPESHTRSWYRRVIVRSVLRHAVLSLRQGRIREALTAFRWFFYRPDLSCYGVGGPARP